MTESVWLSPTGELITFIYRESGYWGYLERAGGGHSVSSFPKNATFQHIADLLTMLGCECLGDL